jgi:hypothetical protein
MATAAKGLDPRTVGCLRRAILLEEEHRPLPEEANPAELLVHVTERLAQAASAIEDQEEAMTAAYVLGAAAFSITAITYLRRGDEAIARTKLKDELVEELDHSIAQTDDVHRRKLASPDQLLRSCLSLLAPALECPDDEEEVAEAFWRLAGAASLAAEMLISRN